MTGQRPDLFFYKDEDYSLVGLDGGELFHPLMYGMETKAPSTACWRGFVATYSCLDSKLVLKDAVIYTDTPKKLNNVSPKNDSEEDSFSYEYENVNLELSFTGRILIARDFIQERYVHMGFQSPSSFREVHELVFKDGLLIEAKDVSEQMEERRKTRVPKNPMDEDVGKWINERFSLDPEKD